MMIPSHHTKSVICVVVILIMLASSRAVPAGEQRPTNQSDSRKARQWLAAVGNNNVQKAVTIASELVPRVTAEPDPSYEKLASSRGIHPRFLADSMNDCDYHRWRTALFFKNLSSRILRDNDKTVEPLFRAVVQRLETRDPEKDMPLWPYYVWKLGKGLCDRQAWVFCELAYQQGWETQIVYLRDPETNVSHHTIAEIRKDDRVYTADPHKNVLLKGYSVRELVDNERLIRRHWPNSEKLWPEFANAIFWTPAYPQDYCPRNQTLYETLQRTLGDASPRFGEDPQKRLDRYDALRQKNESYDDGLPMRLWFFPFVLLRESLEGITD